jgi:two-component system OmpR family sensor kinase
VFERFYRADTSRTRETGGSGLGLAIVAAIVGSHGGSVRVKATDGGGATLVVRLPVRGEDADGQNPDGHVGEGGIREVPADEDQGQAVQDQERGGGADGGRVIHI